MHIKINIPDCRKGKWEVETFTVSSNTYKRLIRHERENISTVVMTNMPAEGLDLRPFIEKAFGNVLIFGLGLGLVVQALSEKENVDSIMVIEIDTELIDFVGAYYTTLSPKVKVVQGDALTYYDDNSYNAIFFDIWDNIDEGNLDQMKFLKRKWQKNSPVRMCWSEKECRRLQKNF